MDIGQRLAELRISIEKVRQNAPLAAPQTTILGASKSQPVPIIEEAIKAGLTVFGENRVQEATEKWVDLKKRHPKIELHLIGPLQTNKVKEALRLFDVIQTVDRPKLAEALAHGTRGEGRGTRDEKIQSSSLVTRAFYIQVNTGKEPQKAGVIPEEANALIEYCKKLGLPITGLMCVPPADQPPAPHFALLREIARAHHLNELSMGMSNDYETAIRMGSTCVRIGTMLFGERK